MSCSAIDVKAYALGELDDGAAGQAAAHLHTCGACREELERLRLTRMALLSLRDEEPPRRIAFVSDKVFEPGWWQRVWQSAPAMGFASAVLLSGAILVNAWTRPVTVAQRPVVVDAGAIEKQVEARVGERLNAAITRAVVDMRQKDQQETARLVAASEQKYEQQRRYDLASFTENLNMIRKENKQLYIAAANIEERP